MQKTPKDPKDANDATNFGEVKPDEHSTSREHAGKVVCRKRGVPEKWRAGKVVCQHAGNRRAIG